MSNLNYIIMHGDLDVVNEIHGIKEYRSSFDVHSLYVKARVSHPNLIRFPDQPPTDRSIVPLIKRSIDMPYEANPSNR